MAATRRFELKDAIFRSGKKQKRIARLVGMDASRLSKILHGTKDPTPDEVGRLARILGRTPDELFGPPTKGAA